MNECIHMAVQTIAVTTSHSSHDALINQVREEPKPLENIV